MDPTGSTGQTMFARPPLEPPQDRRSVWDVLLLACALGLVAAVVALPWWTGQRGVYNAAQILLGVDERRLDYSLIFIPLLCAGLSLLLSVGTLFSPKDARHLYGFMSSLGAALLFYYFNFFVNKGHTVGGALEQAGAGFWLALGLGVVLSAARWLPRTVATEPAPTRLHTLLGNQRFWGLLYLTPVLLLMLVFSLYPMADSLRYTLYNWRGIGEPTQFVGLRHFKTVAGDPRFWNAFGNTMLYTAILVPVQLGLALVLALILENPRMRLRTFYRTLFFVPVVTSISIVAIVVRLLLQTGGMSVTGFLGFTPFNPIASPDTSMLSVTAFGIWYSFGINLVYFMAALQTVPTDLYDAAKIDGANWAQRTLFVTLPSIRPVAIIITFFAVLGSLAVFEQSFVLTGGGPFFSSEVVNGYIYRYAFGSGGLGSQSSVPNLGFASAAALFMGVLVMVITGLQALVSRWLAKGPRAKTE